MVKHFCDACFAEKDTRLLDVPLHITDVRSPGYVDKDMNQDSRSVPFELCLRCYNLAMTAAFASITRIMESHK